MGQRQEPMLDPEAATPQAQDPRLNHHHLLPHGRPPDGVGHPMSQGPGPGGGPTSCAAFPQFEATKPHYHGTGIHSQNPHHRHGG